MAAALTRLIPAPPPVDGHELRLLDPCAGTGHAAALLARALGARAFGIELDPRRAAVAQRALARVAVGDALAIRLPEQSFSLLFLNPPYDEDDRGERLEAAFLRHATPALAPDGVLVLIVPQRRLPALARLLASAYDQVVAWRFPDPEARLFGQVVVLAVRRAAPRDDPHAVAALAALADASLPVLPLASATPAAPAPPRLPLSEPALAGAGGAEQLALAELSAHGAWRHPEVARALAPEEPVAFRPLLPLRQGHLALLLAAGLLDGAVLSAGGRRVLVRGSTIKTLVPVEHPDPDTEVEREVFQTCITLLDLDTGQIEKVYSSR